VAVEALVVMVLGLSAQSHVAVERDHVTTLVMEPLKVRFVTPLRVLYQLLRQVVHHNLQSPVYSALGAVAVLLVAVVPGVDQITVVTLKQKRVWNKTVHVT